MISSQSLIVKPVCVDSFADPDEFQEYTARLLKNCDFKATNKAILLGEGTLFEVSKGIFSEGNTALGALAKKIKVNESVDHTSRDFLINLTSMNEWIVNSSSLSGESFTGIKDFDKLSIKEQLLKLASSL
jgi:hypothetical protein